MSLRPATQAPGSPPATILAKLDRSGRTPNAICAPPRVARKPGDHLVEDQQRAVLRAEPTQFLRERGVERHLAERRTGRLVDHRRRCRGLVAKASRTAATSPGFSRIDFSATPGSTPGVGEPSKWFV